MKRKILSLFLALSIAVSFALVPASAAEFTDISSPNVALAAAVLNSMGIVEGKSETTFDPDTKLTRAEFCALAVRAMGLEDKTALQANKQLFTDVKPGKWYTEYVNTAWNEGIVNGYGDGTFGPNDSITYGQVVTLLLRMLGYSDADVGKVWPEDYVSYASSLDIDKGVSAGTYDSITRGEAALLIYNTLKTDVNGTDTEYFYTTAEVSSTQSVIIMDDSASSGGVSGQLQACAINADGSTAVEYFGQKYQISKTLIGYIGTLLLNSAGKVVGFIPDAEDFIDVKVKSATASTITATNGQTYRITSGASVIYNGSIYGYSTSGYLQVDAQTNKSVRLYYDDDDAIRYIYISSGTSSGSDTAVAQSSSVSALVNKLGVTSDYTITKNSSAATAEDIAKYDVAYFDSSTRTLRISDYRITGWIEGAYPNVEAAETITIAGCTVDVLESAWETLSGSYIGDRVTLLLTDDCKVAAVYSASELIATMTGVLSTDGKSVTLSGSGLVLAASEIHVDGKLYGSLVNVKSAGQDKLSCTSPNSVSAKVDITAQTVGDYSLAPSCAIYEWAGGKGYVYSLAGELGGSSKNFDDIVWTDELDKSYVSYYHLNGAGQVDVLLLNDVTGNSYTYGEIVLYGDTGGIYMGDSYNVAVSVENSSDPNGKSKYLYNTTIKSGYGGLSFTSYSSSYSWATSTTLTKTGVNKGSFYLDDDDWYVTISGTQVKVSDNVQVYIEKSKTWTSGESALSSALSSGLSLTGYYDRTLSTGGQLRVLVVG